MKPGKAGRGRAGELLVPFLMLVFLLGYWWQAVGISIGGQVFPAALSVVLIGLLLAEGVTARRARKPEAPPAPVDEAASDVPLATRVYRRIGLLALATVLIALWRELGGALVIFAFCLGALLLLGERRLWLLAALPVCFAVALTYLFQVVLLVRFPDGLLPLF